MKLRTLARSAGEALLRVMPEILVGLGIIAGWALLTWGVASLLVWQIWPFSAGLLLLSLVGWQYLRTLFGTGLYTLGRSREGERG